MSDGVGMVMSMYGANVISPAGGVPGGREAEGDGDGLGGTEGDGDGDSP
ncbi:MAG: hypothetical protein IRY84_19555, partial [Thermobispora bispora]|nr:hypothetical protein [Thermobispora bispora]